MLSILILIEPNSHGEPLHDFHVVSGRVLWRKQTEKRTGRAWKTLYFPLVVPSESVDANCHKLARPHPFELRLFEVSGDPDVVPWNNDEQALSRLDAVTELDRFSSNHAADRSVNLRVAEIELSSVQVGAGLLQMPRGRFRLGPGVANLLRSDAGGFDLRLALDDKTARFGDLLFSRS